MNPITTAMERLRSNRYTPDFCGYEARQADLDTIEQGLGRQPPAEAQPDREPADWPHQDWKGMDGATAWLLINRHASGWEAVGEMMDAWLSANSEQPPSAPVGVEGFDEWFDEYTKNNYTDEMLALAAWKQALAQQPAAGIFNRIRQTPEYAREMEKLASALGYQNAFHEVAAMLDIPSQPLSPKEVWETQMRPKLLALTSQQPAAVDEVAEHIAALRELYATRNPVGRFARAVKAGIAALAAQQGGATDD